MSHKLAGFSFIFTISGDTLHQSLNEEPVLLIHIMQCFTALCRVLQTGAEYKYINKGGDSLKQQFLPIAILISSFFYIFLVDTNSSFIQLLTKLIPMLLIILYATRLKHTTKSILIGLLFCALGDALIIFSFLPGLAAFLIGHLFYIYAFLRHWQFSLKRLSVLVPLVIFAVYMGTSFTSALRNNGEEALIFPVIFYLVVISLMGFTAFQTKNKYVYFGSILFIISDAVLAWNLFIEDVSYSGEIIMITYYGAQFLIAHSLSVQGSEHKKAFTTIE